MPFCLLFPIQLNFFQLKVKYSMKKKLLKEIMASTSSITKPYSKVAQKGCQGWIHHHVSFFERYLTLENNH